MPHASQTPSEFPIDQSGQAWLVDAIPPAPLDDGPAKLHMEAPVAHRMRDAFWPRKLKPGAVEMNVKEVQYWSRVLMAKWLKLALGCTCRQIGVILCCDAGTAQRWTKVQLPAFGEAIIHKLREEEPAFGISVVGKWKGKNPTNKASRD